MRTNVNRENVGVGKLITWAFHYSARHPYFGRIIKVTASTVWIEELPSIVVSHDGYGQNGTCIADINAPATPHKKGYRYKKHNGNLYIDNCPVYLYDGTPEDFFTD
jgi:hypothetical protein